MTLAESFERLAASGIDLLPLTGVETHFVFHRDGFVALVERTAEGFGAIGSAGRLTDNGFAALVWRAGKPFFVAKDYEQPASPGEVTGLRSFAADLEHALR
jgi:hypothetical protein